MKAPPKLHLPESDAGGTLHTLCGLVVGGRVKLGHARQTLNAHRCKRCWTVVSSEVDMDPSLRRGEP